MGKLTRRATSVLVMGALLGAGLVLTTASPASAAQLLSGQLTTNDPTFVRPNDSGASSNDCNESSSTSVSGYYDLYQVSVTEPEAFTAQITSQSFDTYLALYCDPFDPSSPLNNLMIADDDGSGIGFQAGINAGDGVTLEAGQSYYMAVTSFSSLATGSYTLQVSGATAELVPVVESFDTPSFNEFWTADGLWNVEAQTDTCGAEVSPFDDPVRAAYYGLDGLCHYDTGLANSGSLTSGAFTVRASDPALRFRTHYQDENFSGFDRKLVEIAVDGGAFQTIASLSGSQDTWHGIDVDLSAFVGQEVQIRFRFDTGDDISNGFRGWFVDEVQLPAGPQEPTDEPAADAEVRVTASTPTAEEGGAPGVFTFTRTGETDDSLTIGYGLSGTASAADYAALGIVTFNSGQATVTKNVVATDDGAVEPDETVTVSLSDGDGYEAATPISATVTITDPLPDPEPIDPCDGLADPGFTDVPASNVHAANIDCLSGLGITEGGPGGRPANEYGPRLQTRRDQMASFVARTATELPPAPADAFTDDDTSVHELAINQLADLGIIGGNGDVGPSYFPARIISREEMASFLHRLIEEVTGEPFTTDEDAFTDDEASPYEDAINALASVGIVQGTGGGLYDPDGTVQRDSMASFLVRTITYLANLEGR